jgi:hypothetical protein
MKHDDHDPLFTEIFTGDELADFRRSSLENSLAALRRRQRHRRAARICALTSLPLLLLGGLQLVRQRESSVAKTPISQPPAVKTLGVKIITDKELFALFPDRAMALIGKPGNQQLVFLDQSDHLEP